ncbi:MAG TPA: GNAT family N-acetyltransferase [Thermomicrobiales bacterium]|nr:GNAT family N-acetyltransferase [Thermomicrobiales bacterium]
MTQTTPGPSVRAVTVDDIPAIREVLFAALEAGELAGTTARDLNHELDLIPVVPGGMLVSLAGDEVTGFFDAEYPLLAVHPRHRRQRHATRLVERAIAEAPAHGLAEVDLAPPLGNRPAEAFAASLGFAYRSSLWQLRLDPATDVPPPRFPAGFEPRAIQPGPDDEAYLDLLRDSFADHPLQLNVSLDIIRLAHSRPSFNPSNVAVVANPDDAGQLIAFCRVILTEEDTGQHAEIGHLGVLPGYRGRGLGRELLRWGVHYLRSRGVAEILLAVESRNNRALRIYERAGFVAVQEWPRWAKSGPSPAL